MEPRGFNRWQSAAIGRSAAERIPRLGPCLLGLSIVRAIAIAHDATLASR